jgi:hypothetical protein
MPTSEATALIENVSDISLGALSILTHAGYEASQIKLVKFAGEAIPRRASKQTGITDGSGGF